MAKPGLAPSQDPVRRRNPRPAVRHLPDTGDAYGPDLPDAQQWHPQTRRWWAHVCTCPMAPLFDGPTWQFLLDTALLHDQLWQGDLSLAGEIRMRMSKIGGTVEDRQKLFLRIEQEGSHGYRGSGHRAIAG